MKPTPSPYPYYDIDWGSVADWVAAIAAIGAGFVALAALFAAVRSVRYSAHSVRLATKANDITALTYERDTRQRLEAQARFVYALTDTAYSWEAGAAITWDSDVKESLWEAGAVVDGSLEYLGDGVHQVTAAAKILSARITIFNKSEEIVGPFRIGLYEVDSGKELGFTVGTDEPILPDTSRVILVAALYRPVRLRAVLTFRDSSGNLWTRRNYDPIEPFTGHW